MARKYEVTETKIEAKATEQLRAMSKLPARYRVSDLTGAVKSAARSAIRDGRSYFVAPCNVYGVFGYVIAKTMQAAADDTLMHHTAATFYEVAADRTITSHAIRAAH